MAGDLEGFEKKIKSGFGITLDEIPITILHMGKDAIIRYLSSFFPDSLAKPMKKAALKYWNEHKIKMIK
jgi:hypothetical protein